MVFKLKLMMCLFFAQLVITNAQNTDTTSKITDTVNASKSTKNIVKPPKPKEIKKLEDPLLALAPDLVARLKQMKPNELLVISERFVRNEKRTDESGDDYEVTVTVRLGFSQDMITGIVKEVPLYQSADREMNIVYVKIPVKFCCTTPIDTLHKKKHCGKMSELNDFEDNEYCKDWIQQDDAQAEAANAAGFGKPGGTKTTNKKGGVTGSTSATGEDGFGKPAPKGKPTKKGKKGEVISNEETTDSTGTVIKQTPDKSKDKKGKNEKVEKGKKTEPAAEDGFGKPQPKQKSKKKGKDVTEETPVTNDTATVTKDSAAVPVQEPAKPAEASDSSKTTTKEEPKKEVVVEPVKKEVTVTDGATVVTKESSTNSKNKKSKNEKAEKGKKKEPVAEDGFGKPQPKQKGKKKGKEVVEETPVVKDTASALKDTVAAPVQEPAKPPVETTDSTKTTVKEEPKQGKTEEPVKDSVIIAKDTVAVPVQEPVKQVDKKEKLKKLSKKEQKKENDFGKKSAKEDEQKVDAKEEVNKQLATDSSIIKKDSLALPVQEPANSKDKKSKKKKG